MEHPIINVRVQTPSQLIRLNPGRSLFEVTVGEGVEFPSNATLSWDFGDGSVVEEGPFPEKTRFTKEHIYTRAGIFQSIVSIWNKVRKI